MIDTNEISTLIGAHAYDRDGEKIGKVNQVYVDDRTGRPLWASVNTGFFGTSETLIPLEDATRDGDSLRIAYDKAFVKDAPRIEIDGAISPEEQDRLFTYYDLGGSQYAGDFDFGTTGHDT
ncbi:PRC-barrel domain-containing protein, partial [Agromyces humi]|uniref:PRC-barrel domain-containing protein n=1 Tax=Agromyces humi TaxID=1766800 RepID=UPI001396AFD9